MAAEDKFVPPDMTERYRPLKHPWQHHPAMFLKVLRFLVMYLKNKA